MSLVIVYAGTVSAYANTSSGGWSSLDVITAGATNTINATKTAGGKVLTSAVTVGASASKVGKHLIKGGSQVALAYAVVEILGEGIDWVLDSANNSVRYTDPTASADPDPNHPSVEFYYTNGASDSRYANAVLACKASIAAYNSKSPPPPKPAVYKNVDGLLCYSRTGLHDRMKSFPNPLYDPTASAPPAGSNQDRYIPIATVASKVIANAEAGHAPSQEAVKATALEGFAAGEHDAALDAAAVESDAGTDNPPDTTNPDNPAPTDPAAPFDPSSIIAAINALKALLAGILSSITGLADIFNDDPPPEKSQSETDVPVDLPPEVKNATEFDVDYIGFSSQCPTLQPFSVGIGAASSSMTFDMTPLCDLAVTIRPAIIAIAYFIGLGVIASAIRET